MRDTRNEYDFLRSTMEYGYRKEDEERIRRVKRRNKVQVGLRAVARIKCRYNVYCIFTVVTWTVVDFETKDDTRETFILLLVYIFCRMQDDDQGRRNA